MGRSMRIEDLAMDQVDAEIARNLDVAKTVKEQVGKGSKLQLSPQDRKILQRARDSEVDTAIARLIEGTGSEEEMQGALDRSRRRLGRQGDLRVQFERALAEEIAADMDSHVKRKRGKKGKEKDSDGLTTAQKRRFVRLMKQMHPGFTWAGFIRRERMKRESAQRAQPSRGISKVDSPSGIGMMESALGGANGMEPYNKRIDAAELRELRAFARQGQSARAAMRTTGAKSASSASAQGA